MPISVYDYTDPITFLRDWFVMRKASNRRYSHRVFARAAGVSNPSALLNVISGRRRLTGHTVDAFVRGLRLEEAEAEHFRLLVSWHLEEDPETRARLREAVQIARKRALVRELVGHEPDFLRTWYEPAILELARCEGFQPDPRWVADHLVPPIRVEDAKEALDTLVRLGLLAVGDDGALTRRDVSMKTPEVVRRLSVRMYHQEMLERAQAALERVWNKDPALTPENCWFGGVTIAVPKALVPRLRKEVVELQHRMMALADADAEARERVMQFHFLLFPLTTDVGPGER